MPQVKEYFHDVDLKANQLFNSRLHNVNTSARISIGSSLGPSSRGYMVYDTDLSFPFFWNGVDWGEASGRQIPKWGEIIGDIIDQTDLTTYLSGNYYPLSDNPAGYLTAIPSLDEVLTVDNSAYSDITFYAASNLNMNSGSVTFRYDSLTSTGFLSSLTTGYTDIRNWFLPDASGVIPLTVNNIAPDNFGNITISAGGGTWGNITGDVVDQTDLVDYLSFNYYPLSTNPAGYLTTEVDPVFTTWLATPPNISIFNNNSGYITSSALSPYLTSATAASTYEPIISAGTTSQYWRGDKTWQTFPTIPQAQIQSDWNQTNNTLLDYIKNKPTLGTWSALNYPTWATGTPFVKMTAAGTFSLDTTSYQPLLTNPVTGTGTPTRVAFWDTSSSISSDADLYWDNVNKRLGVGTTTPGYKLDVNGEINTNDGIRIGTNGAKTGFYGGANILDIWAGNNKIATWGLAPLGGTYYDHFAGPVYNTGDSGVITAFKIRSSVTSNSANAAGATQLDISPTYTQQTFGTGTLRGVYYHPQINSLNGSTHIAWENTTGDIIHGNLSGTGTRLVTADNTGKLSATTATTGIGDMLKSVYDVDNDGLVDTAEKIMIQVLNNTGAAITRGQIVYLKSSSSSASTPEALLAYNTTEATSSKTIGAVYDLSIANGAIGYIITNGEMHGNGGTPFDTSMYNVGDKLWLSSTPGGVTTTIPSAPNHAVFIGTVTRSQSVNGRVMYSIQNGFELGELHNVSLTSPPTNNDGLFYETSTSLWKNKSITTALGYTPLQRSISSVSSNTAAGSATATDYVYLVSGTTTITLPTAVGNTNRYTIKRSGAGVVSIATTSGQTIDGSSSPITINVQYVSIDLISNGTNWEII